MNRNRRKKNSTKKIIPDQHKIPDQLSSKLYKVIKNCQSHEKQIFLKGLFKKAGDLARWCKRLPGKLKVMSLVPINKKKVSSQKSLRDHDD